jgi:2-polyprenyl-3-methyl-5-hydroxy-6-metoxy-1,4-benzoquinol methylase
LGHVAGIRCLFALIQYRSSVFIDEIMSQSPIVTEKHPSAKEADWYDDHYDRNAWRKQFGPWYYSMIPHLRSVLTPRTKLLELGCGLGIFLQHLVEKQGLQEENVYAIDQSKTAVDLAKKSLPRAQLSVGDIYRLEFTPNTFDVCLLMETIEHLEEPKAALAQIHSVLAPGSLLYVSFPNFLHLPWLVVRILAEKLNRPNWIVLQPVDKIYTVFSVIKLVERAGFKFEQGIGCGYGPPVLYPLEKEWMTNFLNALRLWRLSFHPILVFRKCA